MTGRGAGDCVGSNEPQFQGNSMGRGGGGQGRRRGRRNRNFARGRMSEQRSGASPADANAADVETPAEQELELLKQQVSAAVASLDQIRERIEQFATRKEQDVD